MGDEAEFDKLTATGVAAAEMLPQGTRLAGRYVIDRILGAGGMGVVYRAEDEHLKLAVALKVLRAERRLSEESIERFRQEIRLARKVTHPNVLRLHDIGRDGDVVFLTMDLVEGMSLRERLAQGPVPLGSAIEMARSLAEGLAAAHDCNIVHRDVKPENVLVDPEGVARLSDFGVANAIGSDRMTAPGAIAGTVDYLSPEQIRGEAVDGRADIYALGLLLHEMLTGETPLKGKSIAETAARRASGRPADLVALTSFPAGVRRIVARCLEPRPDDRYQTARELAADLARGTADLRLKQHARRAAVAAASIVLLAGALWLGAEAVRSRGEKGVAEAAVAETGEAARIAVLPFENATGDTSLDWVRRGLSETVSTALAESAELQIIDSPRVFRTIEALRLGEGGLDPGASRHLAALLEVEAFIAGKVIGDAADRRLDLTVIDAADGTEKRLRISIAEGGLLAAADEGVAQLRAAFDVKDEANAGAMAISSNPAAMTAYDEGKRLVARGETLLAIAPLEMSVARDPQFGAGWSALADAYLKAGRRNDALAASEKAVALMSGRKSRAALIARAQHAVLSGDAKSGLDLLSDAVARFPTDDVARVAFSEQLGAVGRFNEAIDQLKIVVAADSNHPRAWFLLGRFATLSGDARLAADDYLVRALIIQNRVGDAQGRGEVFNAMGFAHERLGELDLARQHYRNAIALREEAGDRRGVARSLANIARLDMIGGDFKAARAALAASLDAMTSTGDLGGVAEIRTEFGVLEEEAGDYAAALEHYRQALKLRQDLRGEGGLASSYTDLAFIYLVLGDFDNAGAFARSARAEYADAGDRHGEMTVLEIDGELAIARGKWDDAARAYVRELELARELEAPFSEAVAEGGLSVVAMLQGRPEAALQSSERAIGILTPMNDLRGIAEFRLRRTAVFMKINLPAEAAAELEKIKAIEQEGNLGQRAEYHRLRGEVSADAGRFDEAKAHFEMASLLAERSGSEALKLRVDLSLTRSLSAADAPDPAGILERAARIDHGPMRLEALELLASRRLAEGDVLAAAEAVRVALRPPARIDPWVDNWRLHALLWKSLDAAGERDSEESRLARIRAEQQLAELISATPAAYRTGLISLSEAEGLNAAAD